MEWAMKVEARCRAQRATFERLDVEMDRAFDSIFCDSSHVGRHEAARRRERRARAARLAEPIEGENAAAPSAERRDRVEVAVREAQAGTSSVRDDDWDAIAHIGVDVARSDRLTSVGALCEQDAAEDERSAHVSLQQLLLGRGGGRGLGGAPQLSGEADRVAGSSVPPRLAVREGWRELWRRPRSQRRVHI